MKQETGYINTIDSKKLFYRHWAPPSKPDIKTETPKALIHINHGMSEHSERYQETAEKLVAAGYAVIAQDHRGHGKSVGQTKEIGHFADKHGWDLVLNDIGQLHQHFLSTYEGIPLILMGHSMGFFISLNYAQQLDQHTQAQQIQGLIFSGATASPFMQSAGLKGVTQLEKIRQGKRGRSSLINKLVFGQFNRNFEPTRTEFDWLSRDRKSVDKYIADPLSGQLSSNQTWYDVSDALTKIFQPSELNKLPKDLPIYLFYGDDDPLGGLKGNTKLIKLLKKANITNISHNNYANGRHEMLNETNKDEVLSNLVNWLNQHN